MEQFIQALLNLWPNVPRPIPLHQPYLDSAEPFMKACLDSGWVSSAGHWVNQFEQQLAQRLQVESVVAVNSGTSALHLCYLAVGAQPGCELLMPALSFVATANAAMYCGAKPHFVEVLEDNMTIDISALEVYLTHITEPRDGVCYNKITQAPIIGLVVVHAFGHAVDMARAKTCCQRFHLALIEDAAQALGSLYQGKPLGSFGDVAALSFNGNKIITTGGGGAVTARSREILEKIRHLSTTAKITDAFSIAHDAVGFNYRMPAVNAALGLAQLLNLDELLMKKRQLHDYYQQHLSAIAELTVIVEQADYRANHWLTNVILAPELQINHLSLLEQFNQANIFVRPLWRPLHQLPMYHAMPRMPLLITESLSRRVLSLPSSPQLLDQLLV